MAPAARYPAVATLAIGLGGTGVRVLRHARRLANGQPDLGLDPDPDKRLVSYLGIDTEPGRADLDGDLELLDEKRLLTLDALEVRRLALRLAEQGERRGAWPEIEDWLPAGLRLVDDLAPMGDALLRPLGRLVFWRYRDLVRGHIARALRDLRIERGPGRLEGARRVLVVASAGGGTGSGLLGDVVDLLRGYEDVLELIVLLVMPQMTSGASTDEASHADARTPQRRRTYANTYACLREQYHLKAGRVRWQGAADEHPRRVQRGRWCDRIYLCADPTGESAARLLVFQQLRAGQSLQGCVADRKPDATTLGTPGAREAAVFSAAAAIDLDLRPFADLRDAPPGSTGADTPPKAGVPEAMASTEDEPSPPPLDEVRRTLRGRLDGLRQVQPHSPEGRHVAALLDDVLGPPSEGAVLQWASLVSDVQGSLDDVVRDPRACAYAQRVASAELPADLAALVDVWRKLRAFQDAERQRGRLVRWFTGLVQGELEDQRHRLGLATLRNALDLSAETARTFVERVLVLLLRARAPQTPVVDVPESASSPPAPATDSTALRARLTEALEQALETCRPRVFELKGPHREKLATCVALLPRRFSKVRELLQDRVPEVLDCQVEIHEHEGTSLWLHFEDPFHPPRDIIGLEEWMGVFKAHGQADILHVDRRLLENPAFAELGDQDPADARCGNGGCEKPLSPDRRRGACPACGRWIRSRCGNADCTLDGLHEHPGRVARACPRCGGINYAAWWPCPRHGKVEHLVPIDKPRCPACIKRHLDDAVRFPEECIGRRPDMGLPRECPGCAMRREQDASHASLMIAPALWTFVVNGVNGHDGERFAELVRQHGLRDGYRCPRCRGFLIPVHHAPLGARAGLRDCGSAVPPGLRPPVGDPGAAAPSDERFAASVPAEGA